MFADGRKAAETQNDVDGAHSIPWRDSLGLELVAGHKPGTVSKGAPSLYFDSRYVQGNRTLETHSRACEICDTVFLHLTVRCCKSLKTDLLSQRGKSVVGGASVFQQDKLASTVHRIFFDGERTPSKIHPKSGGRPETVVYSNFIHSATSVKWHSHNQLACMLAQK